MTESQLRGLGPALDRFLDRFLYCCDYTQTFGHLRVCLNNGFMPLSRAV